MVMDLVKLQILAKALADSEAKTAKLRSQRDEAIRELSANPTYTVADIARYAHIAGPRVSQISKPKGGPKNGAGSGAE